MENSTSPRRIERISLQSKDEHVRNRAEELIVAHLASLRTFVEKVCFPQTTKPALAIQAGMAMAQLDEAIDHAAPHLLCVDLSLRDEELEAECLMEDPSAAKAARTLEGVVEQIRGRTTPRIVTFSGLGLSESEPQTV